MSEREIDIEKDHLVVFRKEGVFSHFRWYIDKDRKELEEAVASHNRKKGNGFTAELSDDRLVREICAYRENVSPYETVIQDVRNTKQAVDDAIDSFDEVKENLDWALNNLWKIKRLEL
jgi:hypothetical protein